MKATVNDLKDEHKEIRRELDELDNKFISQREFAAASKHWEESLKRIDVNVRKLTDHLLERPGRIAPRLDTDL